MSQRRDRAIPLWIDKEMEWSVMVKDYPPDETIQLYHRSGLTCDTMITSVKHNINKNTDRGIREQLKWVKEQASG
jgi:hypothetical protein